MATSQAESVAVTATLFSPLSFDEQPARAARTDDAAEGEGRDLRVHGEGSRGSGRHRRPGTVRTR